MHRLCEGNRAEFDASKEACVVIHHIDGDGPNFKLLGPIFDPKLLMHPAVKKIMSKARPKMIALLKTKRYYSIRDMIIQFKTHLLCVLESSNAAVYHASDTALAPLRRIMDHFLEDLNMDPATAFVDYNLAPLDLRRDIGMLGLLHKCQLGLAHPWLMSLFPPATVEPSGTRYSDKRHDRQILERCKGKFLEMTRNSLFGLVRVYNFLPRHVVHCDTVKKFQKELTKMAKESCRSGSDRWTIMFSPRHVRQG